jgi:hypothetical protein
LGRGCGRARDSVFDAGDVRLVVLKLLPKIRGELNPAFIAEFPDEYPSERFFGFCNSLQ